MFRIKWRISFDEPSIPCFVQIKDKSKRKIIALGKGNELSVETLEDEGGDYETLSTVKLDSVIK